MTLDQLPEVQQLSEGEKLALAAELVELVTMGAEGEPDPRIISLLEKRLAEYNANPEAASTWKDVKARLLKKND